MKWTLWKVLFSLFLLVSTSAAQKDSVEQSLFCDDDAPDNLRLNSAVLPRAVLTALLNTKEAREARRYGEQEGKPPELAKLFRGTKINLADSSDVFFLVIGEFPMSGADNTWFWIVRQSGQQASILLWVGANCLNIKESRTLGLRDISTDWAAASRTITTTYAYDGKRYKLKRRRSNLITPVGSSGSIQ